MDRGEWVIHDVISPQPRLTKSRAKLEKALDKPKGYAIMSEANIKMVKVVSGEQFAAQVEVHEKCITVTKPTILQVIPEQGLRAQPWMLLTRDEPFDISLSHVVCMVELDPEVRKVYEDSILNPSDIVTPPKGLVLPE